MNPFFSIIIPTYNRANMLTETLQSVKNQIFKDWECIIVDDGSTDNTKELINNWIEQDSRFKYVYQDNAERSVARNNGIENAKGKYICFLDSDDKYLDTHLNELYKFLRSKKPEALVFTDYVAIKDKQTIEVKTKPLYQPEYQYMMLNAVIPARICIHNSILKDFKFEKDIVIVEDVILWTRIACKYPVYHLAKATIEYNLHEDNSINHKGNAAIKRLNGLKIFFKRYPDIKTKFSKKQRNLLLGDTLFNIAKHHMFNNRKLKAIKFIILSLFQNKSHHQNKHKFYCIFQLIIGKIPTEYK